MQTVKHIVMWRVAGTTPQQRAEAARQVKSAFERLRGCIPGLLHLEVGIDQSAADFACDVVLVTEFTDAQALLAYASHPEHLRVRDELAGVRIARHQVDYTAQEQPA